MEQTLAVLLLLLLVVNGIAVWALVVALKARGLARKIQLEVQSLAGPREVHVPTSSTAEMEHKMKQLVDDRIDRLFATAMGSPMLLTGVSLTVIPGVMEKIGELVGVALDDPSDELNDQIDAALMATVKTMSTSPEFQEKIRKIFMDRLDTDSESITDDLFDTESETYEALVELVKGWLPNWITAELANPESAFHKELIISLTEKLQEAIDGN